MPHVMVTFTRRAGELTEDDVSTIEDALVGHSFAEAMHGTYVLALTYPGEWGDLREAFKQVVESRRLNYLMSPEMEAGAYAGWLPRKTWEAINRRAKGGAPRPVSGDG